MELTQVRIANGYFTKSDVARQVGVKPHQLDWLVRSGVLPAPKHRYGLKRLYYKAGEVKRIVSFFSQT